MFARRRILKNGKEGKTFEVPSIIELHTDLKLVKKWIDYSTFDAEITYWLYQSLKILMKDLPIKFEDMENNWDLYKKYWRPFGRILTDIERRGIRVNTEKLKGSLVKAQA